MGLHLSQIDEEDELLTNDPLALLIGMILDQRVSERTRRYGPSGSGICDATSVTTGAASSQPAGPPEEARWDFFISYTQVDHVWAEWIAWQLHDAGYQVLIQAWYTVAGSNWVFQMQEGILRSERTVAVLSEDYGRSASSW